MPLDAPPELTAEAAGLAERVTHLNERMRHHSAADVLRAALDEVPKLALVSSFGAESVVLLHLAAMTDRELPVIFIDTEMLFTETLVYQQEVSERLGLRNLRIVRALDAALHDPDGTLHRTDPDACCALRKSRPLEAALMGHGGWITGRKRFQSGSRAALAHFETDLTTGRIKVNPLAYWQSRDVAEYIAENRLPRHPLVAKGYPSIGCAPCTTPVREDEDIRAGRWRETNKEECGIHFANGKAVRLGDLT